MPNVNRPNGIRANAVGGLPDGDVEDVRPDGRRDGHVAEALPGQKVIKSFTAVIYECS
jgi:hypothetical protein